MMRKKICLIGGIIILIIITTITMARQKTALMIANYWAASSPKISDRAGEALFLRPNAQGYYAQYLNEVPRRVEELLVTKEDRAFWWHWGVNPLAIAQNLAFRMGFGGHKGASTITQQLAKNLLGNVNNRSFSNKLRETMAAMALEISQSKRIF